MITLRHLVIALLLFSIGDLASACSCIPSTLTERLDGAELVMIVRVTSTRFDPESARAPKTHAPVHAGFDLVETLKGNAASVSEIQSGLGDGDCGVELLAGRYYLVISNRISSSVAMDFCSASAQLRGFDPLGGEDNFQFRLDAARKHIAEKKPIDACFNYSDVPPPPTGLPAKDRCWQLQLRLMDQVRKKIVR